MVAHDIGIPEAGYIVHAANAYPRLVYLLKSLNDGATVCGQWSLLSRKAREFAQRSGRTAARMKTIALIDTRSEGVLGRTISLRPFSSTMFSAGVASRMP